MFWNVAGLIKYDKETWDYIKGHKYISLCETWVDEKGWKYFKKKLPETHKWFCSYAKKTEKRDKAKRKILVGGIKVGKKGQEWEKIQNQKM